MQNGKGSRNRVNDFKAFRDGWDNIFTKKGVTLAEAKAQIERFHGKPREVDKCEHCGGDLVLAQVYGLICRRCLEKPQKVKVKTTCQRCNGSGKYLKMDDSYSSFMWECEYCRGTGRIEE